MKKETALGIVSCVFYIFIFLHVRMIGFYVVNNSHCVFFKTKWQKGVGEKNSSTKGGKNNVFGYFHGEPKMVIK